MSRAQSRQRVEYRTVKAGRDIEDRLNQLAEEGWRVEERIECETGTWKLLLERPVNGGDRA